MKLIHDLGKDQSGASSIEYGMIAVVVAVVLAVSMPEIGTSVDALFNQVAGKM